MQLWSDLDNTDDTGDSAGSDNSDKPQETTLPMLAARRGRTRRLSEATMFATVRQWLLDDYMPAYCRALAATRIYRRCYLLDALGTSSSANTPGVSELVQSLQALSQTLAQESKTIALSSLVLEQGSSTKRRGKARRELTLPETSASLRTNWLDAAPRLLPQIGQSPSIFLLNPFGQRLFEASDLNALFKRTAPTELCLLLSYKQVEAHLLTALQTPTIATTLNAVLRTDKWKALPVEDEQQRGQAVSSVIDLFAKTMQRHFVFPVQRIALPVYLRPAVVEAAPYALLFATRRQDSLVCMNDALCRYNRHIYDQSHRGVLAEEWFTAQQQARRKEERTQLLEAIVRRGRAQRSRRWSDLRQQVLLDHFGQFLLHEYDDAVRTLIANHTIACEWRRIPSTEENRDISIPGNDDVLIW